MRRTLVLLPATLLLAVSLTACGGSDDTGADESAPPSQTELEGHLDSATADVESLAAAVVTEYEQSGSLPASAEGLSPLSEGNEVGTYEVDGDVAELCVEHVIDGEGVVKSSWRIDTSTDPVRSSALTTGTGVGC